MRAAARANSQGAWGAKGPRGAKVAGKRASRRRGGGPAELQTKVQAEATAQAQVEAEGKAAAQAEAWKQAQAKRGG